MQHLVGFYYKNIIAFTFM